MPKSKPRDSATTKAAILAAAEELFAERGFAGTSISKIADKSDLSGPLIMFHFKDKRGLHEAVKASIVQRYSECLPTPVASIAGLHDILQNIIRAMFSFYRNNPTMMRMANWGRLEGDDDPWPGEAEWHHLYIDHILAAQQSGEIRKDLSPFRALVMITGAIHVWWEYHEHLLRDLGQTEDPEAGDERYFQELMAVFLRGLSSDTALVRHSSARKTRGSNTDG